MAQPELKQEVVDSILDRLEESFDSGNPLTVEQACEEHPDVLEIVREKWLKIVRFDNKYAPPGSEKTRTLPNSTLEESHAASLSYSPHQNRGRRFVSQAELAIERFHDAGGLSEVYHATEVELSREVAVKVLRPDRLLEANTIDFRREVEILGRMSHPGIVSILTTGETIEGRPFYTMPFLNQGNLNSRIREFHDQHPDRLKADEKDFRDLVYRLASACKTIAYAHSRGIVHRDLKAENIMLGNYGETLIIDWGCARRFSRDERFKASGEKTLELSEFLRDDQSVSAMTLRFASPEQLHGGKPVGPESDIYSLGAILYKLLTGENPHQHVDDTLVRKLVLSGSLQSPQTIKQGVPSSLTAICAKAMAQKPEDRYSTALDMAEDLERYLSDLSISVVPDSLVRSSLRKIRRNIKLSALLFASLALLSTIMFFLLAAQSVAKQRATTAAKQRLGLAASMAAREGGGEIDRRWRLLEMEANSSELVNALLKIETNPEDKSLWSAVQNILDRRSNQFERVEDVHHESLFVISAAGTQVARAPYSTESVGQDFAFRDYFHGQGKDLQPGAKPEPSLRPILSVAYQSTNNQGQIKTAFSVPILVTDGNSARVLGRLCMSLAINDLQIFASLNDQSLGDLPIHSMLVEAREYPWGDDNSLGLVLDGGLSNTILKSGTHLQDVPRLSNASVQRLLSEWDDQEQPHRSAKIIDNLELPLPKKPSFQVAFVPIQIPHRGQEVMNSGWYVLLFEKP